jgi:hypothetical protein
MGFKPEPTIYTLNFDGGWLSGLVIKVGCCTVREFHEMISWQAKSGAEAAENNDKVAQRFLDYLIDWNLDNPRDGDERDDGDDRPRLKEGEPAPHTLEGCSLQEQVVMREIVSQWMTAMSGSSEDLGKDSLNGRASQERSLGLGG